MDHRSAGPSAGTAHHVAAEHSVTEQLPTSASSPFSSGDPSSGSQPGRVWLELVAAECAAEAAAAGEDPEELQQAVLLRWLESAEAAAAPGSAVPSARWGRGAVRAESRRARRRSSRETPLPEGGVVGTAGAEVTVLAAEQRRLLADAVARLPRPCPELMRTLFSGRDLTYAEAAGELGMSQGSLGPVRSRCLGCLRTMLAASDCHT